MFTKRGDSKEFLTAIHQLVDYKRSGTVQSGNVGSWLTENSELSVLDALEVMANGYEATIPRTIPLKRPA